MMRLFIIFSLCFATAYLASDMNCVRVNPLVLDAGLQLFVQQVWNSNADVEDAATTFSLISTRFKQAHMIGPVSAESLKRFGPSLYENKSSSNPPLFLTFQIIGRTDDLNERISLLKDVHEGVVEVNSVYTNPVIAGLYLHLFTGSFEMQLEAIQSVFGIKGSLDLQVGHFSHDCALEFKDHHALKYFLRMDFITCEVLPSFAYSPEASAQIVIQACDKLRDDAAALNLTASILCQSEYYTQGKAESGIVGSIEYFRRFWCEIVKELLRNKNHARIIMWAAFDETSINFFVENAVDGWRDVDKAEYHTGWWKRSNSSVADEFEEKVEELPNCIRACNVCNDTNPCCDGMFCPASDSHSPRTCFSSIIPCNTRNPIATDLSKSFEQEGMQLDTLNTAILSAIIISVALISSLAVFLIYRRMAAKGLLTSEELRLFFDGSSSAIVDGELEAHQMVDDLPYNKGLEVATSDFEIHEGQILGSGSFGVVVKGRIHNDEVAVKTTLPGVAKVYLKSLMTEMKVLMYLGQHENIVSLMGSSTAKLAAGKLYLFLELCPFGNLLGFLRSHRDHFSKCKQSDDISDGNEIIPLSCKDLLRWCLQIGNALRYLAEKRVIHGDIAARNILVFSRQQVKLTDFGLSRRLYEYSNYVRNNQEPLPWRHMSLESLRDLSFSVHSDVWAFGVTMWETFSLGEVPFPAQTWSEDFIKLLANGLRPPQTEHAHTLVYDIMNCCWTTDVEARPSINVIHSKLISALNELYSDEEYI